jgi:hypothetical protein
MENGPNAKGLPQSKPLPKLKLAFANLTHFLLGKKP